MNMTQSGDAPEAVEALEALAAVCDSHDARTSVDPATNAGFHQSKITTDGATTVSKRPPAKQQGRPRGPLSRWERGLVATLDGLDGALAGLGKALKRLRKSER